MQKETNAMNTDIDTIIDTVKISEIREYGTALVTGTSMEASFYPPTDSLGKVQKAGKGIFALWTPEPPRSKEHKAGFTPVRTVEVNIVPDYRTNRTE